LSTTPAGAAPGEARVEFRGASGRGVARCPEEESGEQRRRKRVRGGVFEATRETRTRGRYGGSMDDVWRFRG
jgi:hypothetical protein